MLFNFRTCGFEVALPTYHCHFVACIEVTFDMLQSITLGTVVALILVPTNQITNDHIWIVINSWSIAHSTLIISTTLPQFLCIHTPQSEWPHGETIIVWTNVQKLLSASRYPTSKIRCRDARSFI